MNPPQSLSHLSVTPNQAGKRTHRHKRSGAISGDFDLAGLGMFSPPSSLRDLGHTATCSFPNPPSHETFSVHQRLYSSLFATRNATEDEEGGMLNRQFNFSNEEDFSNEPLKEQFHFPPSCEDLSRTTLEFSRVLGSPKRNYGEKDCNLSSPIHLNTKLSRVQSPSLKFFLTDETVLNDENVPEALIDLDEILHVKLQAGKKPESSRVELSRFLKEDLKFSALSNRLLSLQNHGFSSPFFSPVYSKQVMREPTTDAIEEEDDDSEEYELAEDDMLIPSMGEEDFVTANDLNSNEEIDKPSRRQSAFPNIYVTSTGNSSESSLQTGLLLQKTNSASVLEKSTSASSKDSAMSPFARIPTPSTKKSSAKATRYQNFYEQTCKVSNALK